MKIKQINIPIFTALEIAAFAEWKEATPKRKEEICREIGRIQAEEIIREAKAEAERRCGK